MFDYDILYHDVGHLNCNDTQLHALKSKYRDQINSKRRFDSIKTLPELLKVLENRDVLSHESYQPLCEIAQLLQPSFFHQNPPVRIGALAPQWQSGWLLFGAMFVQD